MARIDTLHGTRSSAPTTPADGLREAASASEAELARDNESGLSSAECDPWIFRGDLRNELELPRPDAPDHLLHCIACHAHRDSRASTHNVCELIFFAQACDEVLNALARFAKIIRIS
jgi:hypothetical protein